MRYSVRNVLLYSFKISHEDREGLWILNTYSFWLLTWNLFLHSKGYLKITAAVQAPGDKLPVCSATIFFVTDCSFYKYEIPVSKWSKSQKQRQLQSRERARGEGGGGCPPLILDQTEGQLYLNMVNGSASWFSDMPCDNYKL